MFSMYMEYNTVLSKNSEPDSSNFKISYLYIYALNNMIK